jgi:hypothetical protein
VLDHGVAEGQAHTSRPADFLAEDSFGFADPGAEAYSAFHTFFQIDDPLFLLGILSVRNIGNGAYRTIVSALLTAQTFSLLNFHLLPLFFDVFTRSGIHQL